MGFEENVRAALSKHDYYQAFILMETDRDALAAQVRDLEEVLVDKRRLTRDLDVALHGEDGAAQQASLCDLIEPAKELRAQVRALEGERIQVQNSLTDDDIPTSEPLSLMVQDARHLRTQLARAEAVVEAAERVSKLPSVLLVAEDLVDGTTMEVTPVPITQEYVNAVWNELIDQLETYREGKG
jgi:hypothetical protein